MATTTTKTTAAPAEAPAEKVNDPVGKPVEPEKAKTIDDHGIGVRDPYPTGSPKAQTYAEINGLTKPEEPAK
jgi:hypothetical protein